jgi:hypothetical protein
MCFARLGVVSALTVVLAAHGLDCMGMATPEHAMVCCQKMHCHSHHHRNQNPQDCCKTTPEMHVALGQPSSAQGICVSPVAIGFTLKLVDFRIIEFSASVFAEHSHDPALFAGNQVVILRI